MTISDFKLWESEIIKVVDTLLDKVKHVSFSDYVLLLSRAGYLKEIESTSLSPYVTQSNLEIIQDDSRRRFLHTYLEQFTYYLKENIFHDEEMMEYNINMQLMLYSHVWESKCFLMTLNRIVAILTGKGYMWKIPFEKKQKNNSNKTIPINKGKYIREDILEPFKTVDNKFYDFLATIYNSSIRNGYSHSMYKIDMKKGYIEILNNDSYKIAFTICFNNWEEIFCKSVLLSYYLINNITKRLNSFTKDYPDVKEVPILWPSYQNPGKIHTITICPIELKYKDKMYVEFNFTNLIRND